jgi:hypothetical protein
MFGPRVGDKVRLVDTELFIEVEADRTIYGEEVKFGGGKVIRDGMGPVPGHARRGRSPYGTKPLPQTLCGSERITGTLGRSCQRPAARSSSGRIPPARAAGVLGSEGWQAACAD